MEATRLPTVIYGERVSHLQRLHPRRRPVLRIAAKKLARAASAGAAPASQGIGV